MIKVEFKLDKYFVIHDHIDLVLNKKERKDMKEENMVNKLVNDELTELYDGFMVELPCMPVVGMTIDIHDFDTPDGKENSFYDVFDTYHQDNKPIVKEIIIKNGYLLLVMERYEKWIKGENVSSI